ncbi:MAG: cyclic-di-AMP receptor [Clostridia bacterium]|nr:cyclic-di-AMP receptor [Clostridia bacterium]
MKLVIGIINSDDANDLLSEITKASFQATKLSTSGGFLKMGNVTVLVGVEDEKVDEVVGIFKNCCSRRTQMIPTAPPYLGEGFVSAAPVQVTIGGATLFIIDVDKMIKL